MMLARFFGYAISLSKITYQQKPIRISQAFIYIHIYEFNVQMSII